MRYLDWTYPQIAENLALDEALLQEAEDCGAGPILRIWELPTFAVVLGASGRLKEDVHLAACQQDDIAIARRSSGGGTVVIGPGALNLTVVLPIDEHPSFSAVDTAQCHVLRQTAEGLRALGVDDVDVKGSGDLTIGLQKFSGSAQRRLRRYFLVHASVLYQFPLALIERYTALPNRQPAYRAGRPHGDFVINFGGSRNDLIAAIRVAWGVSESESSPEHVPESRVRALVESKFGDPAWTERL